ncbi:S-adenosyl-L-methionine-dependent methyltransferase [Aspergillus venezuelensis]
MDAKINQIKSLASGADEAQRKQILVSLREVADSIESPNDTLQRLIYLGLPLSMIRTGLDLNVFQHLAKSETPVSVSELATKTGAAPSLLTRILRYLASIGTIKETGKDTFTSNNITKTLTLTGAPEGIRTYFDTCYPVWLALPDFLKEHNYQDVENVTDTALKKAWSTDLPLFSWYQTQPEKLAQFNQYMSIHHSFMAQWHEVYPVEEKMKDLQQDQVFFVDIGGGIGTQSVALAAKYPGLRNRIVVEDIPDTVAQVIQHPRVEAVPQNFFEPQAITGARIYYMRNILHDWPDAECIAILKHTAAALAPHSVILIDEMVIPNTGAHVHATQQDIALMSTLAALERTHDHWYSLVEKAGLKINRIYTYTVSLRESIIEVVKA